MKQALLLLGVSLVMPVFFCGCGNEAEKTEGNGVDTVEINKKWKEMVRPAARRSRLERDSVSVVNQIIRENPGKIRGHCTRVELTEKISDKKWKGFAHLDNGKKLTCYVTESFSGIEVEVEYEEIVAVPVWTWE